MARHHSVASGLAAALLAALVTAAAGTAGPRQSPPPARTLFDGGRALEDTRQLVAIGPRVAGTDGAARGRTYIAAELKKAGLTVAEQPFEVRTPLGRTTIVNLRATIKGAGPAARRLIIGGHYDTKRFTDVEFVGANDGGSSAAFLIELARALEPGTLAVDVELLFLDAEEAVVDWDHPSGTDHTYGSREYVKAARQAGTLGSIGAFILVDMIGDRDLNILREPNSTPWLTDAIWSTAAKLGRREFVDRDFAVEDDHLEFLAAGVAAVDLIDLDYPAWHRAEDRMDQLSAASFQAVGDVLLAALPEIAARVARGER